MHANHQDPCCLEPRQASSIWMSVIPKFSPQYATCPILITLPRMKCVRFQGVLQSLGFPLRSWLAIDYHLLCNVIHVSVFIMTVGD